VGEKPFESFKETDLGIVAYISEFWAADLLGGIYIMNSWNLLFLCLEMRE
jgi:hypothetical protein